MLWASSPSGEYPVFVGPGILGAGWWPLAGRRFLVTDTNVGARLRGAHRAARRRVEVEPGEGAKTMAEAERVLRELARAGTTREDHVVALGGGVVGDLAGFCAHTYQRGCPVVQVPTTLVAQVDSAYGGKTGVDLPEGKNYAGAYHLPAAVLTDTAALATLPPAELAAGFVEAIKTGLLAGGALWERVRGDRVGSTPPASTTSSSSAPATSARWSPPTSATAACATSSTSATRSATRSRPRAATRATATARRSASGCWRRCGSPRRRSCATRSRRCCFATGCRSRSTARSAVDAVLDALQRDKKRTADGVGFVLLSSRAPREGQVLDPDKVRAAVEEL